MLTDKEKEIMNCIIDCWDENARMIGDASYQEVFELLDKLGLKRPERLSKFLHAVDVEKIRDPAVLGKLL